MNRMNKIIKPILNRRLLIIGFGVALYFLVAQFFGYLVGEEVFTGLILSIIGELLILVNTMPMKLEDPSMSVYLAVH
jgi:hypothetical protein